MEDFVLPERDFGVRDKWDGVARLNGKPFKFKHPKRVGPSGRKRLRDLARRERQLIEEIRRVAEIPDEAEREAEADRVESEHRKLNIDHLGIYLGDAARDELLSDEENYPADELAVLLKFIMDSKGGDQAADPLGSESQVTLIGTSSLPA